MKKIIASVFALIVMNAAYGQGHFELGSNVIGVGLGIGSTYGLSGYGGSDSPGINIQYEHGKWDVGGPGIISLGGYFGFKNYSYDHLGSGWSSSITVFGVRSAYHFNGIESDKFDLYGGLMLGFRIVSYSENIYGINNDNSLIFTAFVGGRYYFSDSWAGFVELGNGVSVMSIGAAYKF